MFYLIGIIVIFALGFMFWGKKGIRYALYGLILLALWKSGLLIAIIQIALNLFRWFFVKLAYLITKLWDYFHTEVLDFVHFYL